MPHGDSPRVEDRPLHDDVRRLASTLGEVIRRLEGDEAFEDVESLRIRCRTRRRGDDGAVDLGQLRQELSTIPAERLATVARAFTLFFLIINTAEQVHRVRRRRFYDRQGRGSEQPGSLDWALAHLKAGGREAAEVEATLRALRVSPVLTAHPTESTRRTILSLQTRVSAALLARDAAGSQEQKRIDQEIAAEIEILWLTSEVRQNRIELSDEVSTTLWYLEDRLIESIARTTENLEDAFERAFGRRPEGVLPLRAGSWVGGDRDGNPNVTPEATVQAARRNSCAVLNYYAEATAELYKRLSLSSQIAPVLPRLRESLRTDWDELPAIAESHGRLLSSEPLRLKLRFMRARLERSRQAIRARIAGEPPVAGGYESAEQFEADLLLVHDSVSHSGSDALQRHVTAPLLDAVRVHGFHGYLLDIREDAEVHRGALDDIAAAIGEPAFDRSRLHGELAGRRPLISDSTPLSAEARSVVEVFRSVATIHDEIAPAAAETYIISMARSVDDVLRVLLLGREAGLVDLAGDSPRSTLDVVPLFETLEDLENAGDTLSELLSDPVYKKQLAARHGRQEVMLGYSDSAKDAGLLPASWALYQAQENLASVCDAAGIDLTLFHGRGGTVGRGGGSPVYRALQALPPQSSRVSIKITEQGEVISQKFGLEPIADRSLEVMLAGTLVARFDDWRKRSEPAAQARYREIMAELSAAALPVFRGLVYDDERLFQLFLKATPVEELARVHFGSRPAYRKRGAGAMAGIRAIPWVFGWTQIRLMLPGWLGVGTALQQLISAGHIGELAKMASDWPFFDDLLGKVEMVCAKADLEVARLYIDTLGPDKELVSQLEAEFERTVSAITQIRKRPLLADQVQLQSAIDLRNPYLDPLSLVQVELLRRKRELSPEATDAAAIDTGLGSALNGVAQGLRNTG